MDQVSHPRVAMNKDPGIRCLSLSLFLSAPRGPAWKEPGDCTGRHPGLPEGARH